jgi:conjugative relaxase-like TrwC/TraI family protein
MLSIGKLAVGQERYYLEQADARIDRATSVASGVEDYYLEGPEPDGVWIGTGSARLSTSGRVTDDAFRRVLDGCDPHRGEPLGRHAAARVPGFDVTFSAPKSVSVLFGIGDEPLRRTIRDAHERAVRDAFGYLERHAAVARRGPAGCISVRGNGLVAAAFRHRASRAGDPQLHTHVVVANLVQADDGRWSARDARRLYAHAKTAGYLYEARLRAELTRELGVEWTPIRIGIADIVGVPRSVLEAFSRRRAQIEQELVRRGQSGPRAAQAATLETRRRKDHAVTPATLDAEWRARAAVLGFTLEDVRSLLGREWRCLDADLWVEIHRELAGRNGLTRARSSFTRRDVQQAWCEQLPAGAPVDVALLERLADQFLESDDAIVLAVGEPASVRDTVLKRRDGRMVRALPDERRYSTRSLLRAEERLMRRALQGRDAGVGLAAPEATERAIAARPTLSAEQEEIVRRLAGDGDAVAVVVGVAGAGKTFALAAAREAWEASGTPVIGAAVAWRAARGLEEEAGIAATSVAAILARLESDRLPRRSVLVVDEAAMVGTRQLVDLAEATRRARGKLVLGGDDRQVPAIEAGGAFRGLRARLRVIELPENRRQVEEWERDALALLRDGRGREALDRYQAHGRLRAGDGRAMSEQLVADWWRAHDPEASVMLAYRRADVAELNRRARELMVSSGAVRGAELLVDGRPFAAGDRVLLRRNDRRLGVANGDRALVTAVDVDRRLMGVRVGDREIVLPPAYLDRPGRPTLQHGYAMTGHAAQGLTVDRAFVLATEDTSREWLYMAMSRGRLENRIYGATAAARERDEIAPAERVRDAAEVLDLAVQRSVAQRMAIDSHARVRAPERDIGLDG